MIIFSLLLLFRGHDTGAVADCTSFLHYTAPRRLLHYLNPLRLLHFTAARRLPHFTAPLDR